MLTKYGRDNIIVLLAISIVLILAGIGKEKLFTMALPGILLLIFTFMFFRSPKRKISSKAEEDPSCLLSPCDGKVMRIENVYEEHYLKSETIRISIFLAVTDVHTNRVPASGSVEYINYQKGRFFAAYDHRSSDKNEMSVFGVENSCNKYVFKQIVGIMARRIVYDLKVGDQVQSGNLFGMMRFGSRMDIYFPLGSEIKVKEGERVIGGISILGFMKCEKKHDEI